VEANAKDETGMKQGRKYSSFLLGFFFIPED
jgi:hypothetical protein